MQEILAQQRNAAKPVTGKGFLLGVTGVIVKLSIAQLLVNLLIVATGIGLLNIAFYLYAIWVIVAFMGRTVAGSLYMLKENALYLQKTLGDSTVSVTEIPLQDILAIRPVVCGERLECSYRRVTVVDAACAKTPRMRFASGLSVLSASLARRAAGRYAYEPRGVIVAYMEEGKRCCCVFRPDDAFLAELERALPDAYGADERTRENTPVTLMAQALQRAFPDLYAHVEPLVSREAAEAAKQEIALQKQAKKDKIDRLLHRPEDKKNSEEAVKTDEVQDNTL